MDPLAAAPPFSVRAIPRQPWSQEFLLTITRSNTTTLAVRLCRVPYAFRLMSCDGCELG